MEKIPVFDRENKYVCDVDSNFSYTLGSEYGWLYKSIAKLPDDRYALVCISYLCCDRNVAYIITPAEALVIIHEYEREELLDREEFSDLEDRVGNTLVINKEFDIVPQLMFE